MRGLRPVCNGFLIKLKKPIKPTVLVSFLKKIPSFSNLVCKGTFSEQVAKCSFTVLS